MPYRAPAQPLVQLALDFVNLDQALRVADEAVPAGAGIAWIEAGTPLIKTCGLDAVRALRVRFPQHCIVADMKVMDAGRTEVEYAHKAGADVVSVLAASTDATIAECVEAGRHVGVAILADLVACADPAARAAQVEALGVDLVSVHTPIDQQMQGQTSFAALEAVARAVRIPVACAGGLDVRSLPRAVAAGAKVLIVGGAISKAPSAKQAAADMLAALAGAPVASQGATGQRVGLAEVRTVFAKVSTPNISDALHRGGALRGLVNRNPGKRFAGPAFTVQAAPGDWSKPVQAIDHAEPGSVLVIDAAGQPPALWGGLATLTAATKGLAGVVIEGACRDTTDIVGSALGLWSTHACPDAGEPKGMGAFGLPVRVGGAQIHPGDWIVGDDDGLVHIPARLVVEAANRAADIHERENRLAAEIRGGRTLAQIAELKKWDSRH